MANTTETDSPKARLREQAFARRDALPADERAAAAEAIAARPFPVTITTGIIVSGFSPMKTEINPLPLMRKAAQLGARLALPAIAGRGRPLIMRAYAFGDELARGQWGIREPKADAPEVAPDILIVPLAAFDRAGHRIGYGAGYYDRLLGAWPEPVPPLVAAAFELQVVPAVPMLPTDRRIDLVATELRTYPPLPPEPPEDPQEDP